MQELSNLEKLQKILRCCLFHSWNAAAIPKKLLICNKIKFLAKYIDDERTCMQMHALASASATARGCICTGMLMHLHLHLFLFIFMYMYLYICTQYHSWNSLPCSNQQFSIIATFYRPPATTISFYSTSSLEKKNPSSNRLGTPLSRGIEKPEGPSALQPTTELVFACKYVNLPHYLRHNVDA